MNDELQLLAVHVLARRRHAVTGRIGLRITPGGFGTPPFGDHDEVLRISGGLLVRESNLGARSVEIDGATLREIAAFAGADLSTDFSAGHDTPSLPDPDEPISLDPTLAPDLSAWWALGVLAIDTVLADREAARLQLWPEHFDVGTSVGDAVNLGASPGDAFSSEPYLYVGPWGPDRPGDEAYWNAPFGAVARRSEIDGPDDAVAFFAEGLGRLT